MISTNRRMTQASFYRLPQHSQCCSGSNAQVIARSSRPCGCHAACLASPQCNFFSFNGLKGECRSCRVLSDCNASSIADGHQIVDYNEARLLASMMLTSTWSKQAPASTILQPERSLFEVSASILPGKPCPKELNLSLWKPRVAPMAAALLTNRMARFLGTDRRASEREAMPAQQRPRCVAGRAGRGGEAAPPTEEERFRLACSVRIAEFDGHLNRSRSRRRALLIESPGRSQWGWGNVLPFVYALHLLCLRAERLCLLSLQDQDFGDRLGYADGQRWQAEPEAVLREFEGASVRTFNLSYSAWSYLPCSRYGALHNLEAEEPAAIYNKAKRYRWCKRRLEDQRAELQLDGLAERLRLETTNLVRVRLGLSIEPSMAFHGRPLPCFHGLPWPSMAFH